MGNHETSKKDVVLVIDDDGFMCTTLKRMLLKSIPDIDVITTVNAVEGIGLFREFDPCVVLIDANMPLMNGFSVCSILRGTEEGKRTSIYMITSNKEEEKIRQAYETGFDFYFEKPINEANFTGYVKRFFDKRKAVSLIFKEIEKARKNQSQLLPEKIVMPNFCVDYIYSPYKELSGDFVDYWLGTDESGLCGYLFDVAGHDISSALLVSELRTLFKYGFKHFGEVNEVLAYVSNSVYNLHEKEPIFVAGLAFKFDFKQMTLAFSSAAVPSFYIVSESNFVEIPMSGYLLGMFRNSDYCKKTIKIENVDEIIFSSDGFSELLLKNSILRFEKHDDVSAIMIRFKKNNSK